MPWDIQTETLENGRIRQTAMFLDNAPFAYAEAIAAWREDAAFRDRFMAILAEAPFDAYFWETPPVNRVTVDRPFEFVIVDGPALAAMAPDSTAFSEHFPSASGIAAFRNLGGDAIMIAPDVTESGRAYPHLAAFARTAPGELQHEFWRIVGEQTAAAIGERPLWISTSGLGVAWLHVRLDSRPKYYTYNPYRTAA